MYFDYIKLDDAVDAVMNANINGLSYNVKDIETKQKICSSISRCQRFGLSEKEVVYCKVCEFHNNSKNAPSSLCSKMKGTDFCSLGKRIPLKYVEHEYIEVGRDEFYSFINNYPRELNKHGVYFCTPSMTQYIDFPDDFDPDFDHPYNYCVAYLKDGLYNSESDSYYIRTDLRKN